MRLYFILVVVVFTACQTDVDVDVYGTWQLESVYISAGGEGQWQQLEESHTIVLRKDQSFRSDRHEGCNRGTFKLTGSQIIFNYSCEDFTLGLEDEQGVLPYQFKIEKGDLILSPTYVWCVEGCEYRYSKID